MTKKLLGMLVLTSAVGLAYAESKGAPPKTPAPTPAAKPTPAPGPAGGKGGASMPAPTPPMPTPEEMAAMMSPKPGPETMALSILATNGSWTGTIPAGAMGPGSPEMPTKGTSACKWVVGKLWLQCTVKETMGTGKTAMKNEGIMFVGWDFTVKEYRSTWVGSDGAAVLMAGKMEGTKFWLETKGDHYMMMGQPSRFRLIWDWTDAKAPTLTYEASMGKGAPFKTVQTAKLKGLKIPK